MYMLGLRCLITEEGGCCFDSGKGEGIYEVWGRRGCLGISIRGWVVGTTFICYDLFLPIVEDSDLCYVNGNNALFAL